MQTSAQQRHILVVDDEDGARAAMVYLLQDAGFSVIQARDGVEGIAAASTYLPDAILMDIGMPIMDGCRAAEILKGRAATQSIPIIACTGAGTLVEEWLGLFEAVVRKPFTSDAVISVLDKHLP